MKTRYIIVREYGFNTTTIHGPFDFTTAQLVEWVDRNIGGDYHHEDDVKLKPGARGHWCIGYPAAVELS